MKNVYKVLRFLFGSGNNSSKRESYRIWAKTEYGNDWQFAYQYLLDHQGQPPKRDQIHLIKNTNENLRGWV